MRDIVVWMSYNISELVTLRTILWVVMSHLRTRNTSLSFDACRFLRKN